MAKTDPTDVRPPAPRKLLRLPRRGSLARDESGLLLFFLSFGFLGIFAFLAIVVEAGLVVSERRSLQNTADAVALAGAQELFANASGAEAAAEAYAAAQADGLVTNDAVVQGAQVTVTVSRPAQSLFGGPLSFGEPEVRATATARLAGPRLPGKGATCIAVEVFELLAATQARDGVNLLTVTWAALDPYTTVLRLGAGGSNAGYIDIKGSENQSTRDCLRDGSANPLKPVEETQTGIAAGQAAQALQERLEAARDRTDNGGDGCFSWEEIVRSIEDADTDLDGIADLGSWVCHPLYNQDTAVFLMPIVVEDFQDDSGTMPVHVFDMGTPRPFLTGMFFVDAKRTFENVDANKWKFIGGGQGQAEIVGVFLDRAPVMLGDAGELGGSEEIVDCVQPGFVFCFAQLID